MSTPWWVFLLALLAVAGFTWLCAWWTFRPASTSPVAELDDDEDEATIAWIQGLRVEQAMQDKAAETLARAYAMGI